MRFSFRKSEIATLPTIDDGREFREAADTGRNTAAARRRMASGRQSGQKRMAPDRHSGFNADADIGVRVGFGFGSSRRLFSDLRRPGKPYQPEPAEAESLLRAAAEKMRRGRNRSQSQPSRRCQAVAGLIRDVVAGAIGVFGPTAVRLPFAAGVRCCDLVGGFAESRRHIVAAFAISDFLKEKRIVESRLLAQRRSLRTSC